MQFIKVAQWTWYQFFTGKNAIYTELSVIEDQVRAYIEASTARGGSGNWDPSSLRRKEVKIKAKKLVITNVCTRR